jgi:hypothetical protein
MATAGQTIRTDWFHWQQVALQCLSDTLAELYNAQQPTMALMFDV